MEDPSCWFAYLHLLKHWPDMAPHHRRLERIDDEAVLLVPDGDVGDAMANLFAEHGHRELEEFAVADLRVGALEEMAGDLRSDQERQLRSQEAYREHTAKLGVLIMEHRLNTLCSKRVCESNHGTASDHRGEWRRIAYWIMRSSSSCNFGDYCCGNKSYGQPNGDI